MNATRRQFLLMGGLSCVMLMFRLSSVSAASLAGGGGERDLSEGLSAVINNKDSAVVIGREYVRLTPNEANKTILADLILKRTEGAGFFGREQLNNKVIKEYVQKSVRSDFHHERIVKVNGWLLSETEARVCAFIFLHE